MSNKKIYIVGRGVINPAGNILDVFWRNLLEEKQFFSNLKVKGNVPIKTAAIIRGFDLSAHLPKRVAIKTDTFTHYFLAAVKQAIEEAKLLINKNNEEKIGIFYGNNSGGWRICERGFEELFRESYDMVNPWQATAWFQTAGQGYASIIYGIKGFSKTFVADRVSGAAALYYAIQTLNLERNKTAIVGGSEAPLTDLGTICYNEGGGILHDYLGNGCKPFMKASDGVVLSEGGAAIVLETSLEAIEKPLAEITGSATTFYPDNQQQGVIECMKRALCAAKLDIEDIDLIIPEGNGDWKSDCVEKEAILSLFGNPDLAIPIFFTKYYFGHQYGAALITDVICASLAIRDNEIPHYRNITELDGFTDITNGNIRHVLVNSRTAAGVNYTFIISKII